MSSGKLAALGLFLLTLSAGGVEQISLARLDNFPALPQGELRDWHAVAQQYTALVFNQELQGDFLPLPWWDRRGVNFNLDHLALAAYVGDARWGRDGAQEAINVIAAVRSATLVGLDMSHWQGMNLVIMQKEFFNRANGQNLVLNNPTATTGNSFWYEIYPSVLFFILADLYPQLWDVKASSADMSLREIMYTVADRWHTAVQVLKGDGEVPNFNWQAFDFARMEPVYRWWREPDAAAGVAWILYMAYTIFGEERFLTAAQDALNFLQSWAEQKKNPLYEVLLPYGALAAARLNAERGTAYDVETFVAWCFGVSNARPGWGMITGVWDGVRVDGLIGSLTDQEGYAFAMNTLAWAEALVPLVRYDPRFARVIGKWTLHTAVNARLFYGPYHPPERQSSAFWKGDPEGVIPYEGLRRYGVVGWDIVSPYATGDAIRNKWARTDLALYAGSHAGVLGAIVHPTNVAGILRLDLLATDYFRLPAYPTYLLYNPYNEARPVEVEVGTDPRDVYDAVSHTFLVRDAVGKVVVTIPPDSAVMLVLVPTGKEVVREGRKLVVDGVVIDWRLGG